MGDLDLQPKDVGQMLPQRGDLRVLLLPPPARAPRLRPLLPRPGPAAPPWIVDGPSFGSAVSPEGALILGSSNGEPALQIAPYGAARRAEAPVDVQRSRKTAALNARRTMKAAFKDWEGVLTDWSELAIPAPA